MKPNELWFDQGKELYNKLMQEWLSNDKISMYSTHNEGNSVIAERFIKILNDKNFKKERELMIVNLILVIWIT